MAKTASFGILHLGTAFGVSYALTGSVAIAGAITFVEPAVNTVMHYFHDRHWPRFEAWWRARRALRAARSGAAMAPLGAA